MNAAGASPSDPGDGDRCRRVRPDVRRVRPQRQPTGAAVRATGRRASPPTNRSPGCSCTARHASASRCCCWRASTAAARRAADAELARCYPNLTAHPIRRRPAPGAADVLRASTWPSSSSCWRRAARRPTRSVAARCCCRCSACSPPRSGRSPTSTSAPAPGSTCCSTATSTRTCPAATSAGPRRCASSAAPAVAVPVPSRCPRCAERRRARPVAGRRARPRAAAMAGGVRVAGPDRPLRAAARRAGDLARRAEPRRPAGRRRDRHGRPRRRARAPTR